MCAQMSIGMCCQCGLGQQPCSNGFQVMALPQGSVVTQVSALLFGMAKAVPQSLESTGVTVPRDVQCPQGCTLSPWMRGISGVASFP